MEFYTMFEEKRPVRLCETTRKFAYESIYEHKYGLDALSHPNVTVDHIDGFAGMSAIDKYDAMIYEIATKAPVRICEGERISGAATLGDSIRHIIPTSFGGNWTFMSVSHLTIDFSKVLTIGINGIEREALQSLERFDDQRRHRFIESCLHCIECFKIWHSIYIEALEGLDGYKDNVNNLRRVPLEPPRNFYEAVQAIWFTFAFVRLCGNWPGIGRIDQMLGDFLKRDLEDGTLTLDEAREILAHFFIKGCEWITGKSGASGDAQHYQNLVLAGIDENGNDVTNNVTYLVLDIVEELGIADFPITVRFNKNSDQKLVDRVAEVMRYGNGVIAIYNEDLILKALSDFDYPDADAKNFANDGCWEVQIPGATAFSYVPFDGLAILQKKTLASYSETINFDSFEELYSQYLYDLGAQIEGIFVNRLGLFEDDKYQVWKPTTPATVVSIFENDCIKRGYSYYEGGTRYTVVSPHIGGLADVVNSLYAIKKVVFDDRKLSFADFMSVLRSNWERNEELRLRVLSDYEYYGNDNDEVDEIASRLLSDFADICLSYDKKTAIRYNSGVSTFGRQIEWAPHRMACPHGRRAGEVLAANATPTPGTSLKGATSIIKSYCKADLSKQTTGTALDIRLFPSDVSGERGIAAIGALIRSFVALGGYFMQIDVADAAILRDAQEHPENYPALSVRISGWNARFVTLSREWQDMVIKNIE